MSEAMKGPWVDLLLCGKCEYHRTPVERSTSCCPKCGSTLGHGVGRAIFEAKEKRSFFGLFKSEERVIVGIERLNG